MSTPISTSALFATLLPKEAISYRQHHQEILTQCFPHIWVQFRQPLWETTGWEEWGNLISTVFLPHSSSNRSMMHHKKIFHPHYFPDSSSSPFTCNILGSEVVAGSDCCQSLSIPHLLVMLFILFLQCGSWHVVGMGRLHLMSSHLHLISDFSFLPGQTPSWQQWCSSCGRYGLNAWFLAAALAQLQPVQHLGVCIC